MRVGPPAQMRRPTGPTPRYICLIDLIAVIPVTCFSTTVRVRRLATAVLVLGILLVLPACGLMGGNGDGEDSGKFPEPPDRPSSAHVVMPDGASDAGPALATMSTSRPSSPEMTGLSPR